VTTTERLIGLSEKVASLIDSVETEEATKTALIMPFIRALGYDVFDPTEVVPEFTADVGVKKHEKVDYAVCRDGEPIILFECKTHGSRLESYSSQLYRYFSVTDARIAILTDGVRYLFYSDLKETNRLDSHPFMRLDLSNPAAETVAQVAKLARDEFNLEAALRSAEEMLSINQIRAQLHKELADPSDAFVRLLTDHFHDGRFTQSVMDSFRELTKTAVNGHMAAAVDKRLRSALVANERGNTEEQGSADEIDGDDGIVTTAEELQGLYMVKAILRDLVQPTRVIPRDVRSYFGILLDDNNRKPICRLWFNGSKKYVGVFDNDKVETRIPINGPDALFEHADAIRKSAEIALSR